MQNWNNCFALKWFSASLHTCLIFMPDEWPSYLTYWSVRKKDYFPNVNWTHDLWSASDALSLNCKFSRGVPLLRFMWLPLMFQVKWSPKLGFLLVLLFSILFQLRHFFHLWSVVNIHLYQCHCKRKGKGKSSVRTKLMTLRVVFGGITL